MKIFVTNLPSFYKIKLYNELAAKMPIYVIFNLIGGDSDSRNEDFFHGDIQFKYLKLRGNLLKKIWSVFLVLRRVKYEELIIGGWENLVSLLAPFFSRKSRNSCIIESSDYESTQSGIKGLIKRWYMSRISRVYASGVSQARLARNIGFMGEIKLTGGCGILNYVDQPAYEERTIVKNFLYVGRFVEVKNLEVLIDAFNQLPDLKLQLVGFGELETNLRKRALGNIIFVGAVDNKKMWEYYRNADVFILPSKSEAWGLVVEEALNNGCPVIVSDKVGCRESLVTNRTGIVFTYDSSDSLKRSVREICDVSFYNCLRKGVSELNFKKRSEKQVKVYL